MTDFRLINKITLRAWLILLLLPLLPVLLSSSLASPLSSPQERRKRQTFDFSTNTRPPATNRSLDSDSSLGGLEGSSTNETNPGPVDDPFGKSTGSGNSSSQNEDRCSNVWQCQLQGHVCFNGGTCYEVDAQNCNCTCPPQENNSPIYDKQCKIVNSDNATTAINASSDEPVTDCVGNGQFICQNGYCVYPDDTPDRFSCKCHPGWTGVWCDTTCSRNCSNWGTCELRQTNGTEEEVCVCPYPWIGPRCTQRPPDDTVAADGTWVYWVGGSLAVGLILVGTLAALVLFCLWKKRLVIAMKFVYYFKAYEDNDGLRYDAFVSYVSRPQDEDFVYRHLHPKLEREMGFKLCLHQRDFVVGNAISNNICEALEDSRRLILVISPRYLRSEWAEFEYQKAFHDMLKLKMRIVPIIMEEISPDQAINPTLKAILQSVTYIQYPGGQAHPQQLDKFWKRVHLSMPKMKTRETLEGKTSMAQVGGTRSGQTQSRESVYESLQEPVSKTVILENVHVSLNQSPKINMEVIPLKSVLPAEDYMLLSLRNKRNVEEVDVRNS